jgi:AbrB family looped-hinge helix DNA binding protein
MSISIISAKGQITLPAKLRKKFGLRPNDRVVVESTGEGILIRSAGDFFELDGFLGKGLPREEERVRMMKGIVAHLRGKRG